MPFDGATTQNSPQQKGQINLAPVEPLQKLKSDDKSYECSTLNEIVREMHNEITNRNLQERREIAEAGRLMANLRSGKLIMQRDPIHGGLALLTPLPHKPRKDRHIHPLAQVNSSQLTSIWTLSRPRSRVRHFGNTNRAQIQQALIEKVINHYDAELFDELFHQQESLSMMDYGTSAIRVFYDNKLNAIKHLQPVIENTNQTVFDGYGFCQSCGFEGAPDNFTLTEDAQTTGMPQCPECKSFNVPDLVPAQMADVAQIVGVQEITQGDIGAELLSIPAVNWDMRYLIHESSFVQVRSEVPLRLIESILGIEVQAENPDTDYGLNVINALGTRGGSVDGYGRDNLYGNAEVNRKVAVMHEDYFEPEWYVGRKLDKDEITVSGETIPKGVPLEKIFPDGMCAVGFNEMQILANVSNEKRRIVGGVYHIQSFSGVGKGTQDSIEISEHLNIAHSAAIEFIKRAGAGGGIGYDKSVLTQAEAKKLLKPGGLVGVNMRGTAYTSLNDALWKIDHGELSQSNLAMIAQLSNLLNISFQTTEFTAGVADSKVDVNTLGGQQLLMAQNQQRSAAPLRIKGYTRSLIFPHVIDLFRTHSQIPRFFGTGDKFGLTKGRFISGADIPENVKCEHVPDSEIPTNSFTKRENIRQMSEQSVNFSGYPFAQFAKLDPRMAAWYANEWGAEIPMLDYENILIRCQERLDNLKEIVEQEDAISELSGFYQDPVIQAEQVVNLLDVPLALSEENHIIKAQVIGEYLDDDEVKEWSPLMRASVEALIGRHETLDVQKRTGMMAKEQQGQIGLQAQAFDAQQQMQQPLVHQQQQEQNQAMMSEGLNRVAGLIEKEDDFSREQEGKDLDLQRNLQFEKAKQKERPKPTGKK